MEGEVTKSLGSEGGEVAEQSVAENPVVPRAFGAACHRLTTACQQPVQTTAAYSHQQTTEIIQQYSPRFVVAQNISLMNARPTQSVVQAQPFMASIHLNQAVIQPNRAGIAGTAMIVTNQNSAHSIMPAPNTSVVNGASQMIANAGRIFPTNHVVSQQAAVFMNYNQHTATPQLYIQQPSQAQQVYVPTSSAAHQPIYVQPSQQCIGPISPTAVVIPSQGQGIVRHSPTLMVASSPNSQNLSNQVGPISPATIMVAPNCHGVNNRVGPLSPAAVVVAQPSHNHQSPTITYMQPLQYQQLSPQSPQVYTISQNQPAPPVSCSISTIIAKQIPLKQSTNSNDSSVVAANKSPLSTLKPSIKVPYRWLRVIHDEKVHYESPSGIKLENLRAVRDYLQTNGTCKCGLQCPLRVESTFNFEPSVVTQHWLIDDLKKLHNDLTQLCNHKRKIVALATLDSCEVKRSRYGSGISSSNAAKSIDSLCAASSYFKQLVATKTSDAKSFPASQMLSVAAQYIKPPQYSTDSNKSQLLHCDTQDKLSSQESATESEETSSDTDIEGPVINCDADGQLIEDCSDRIVHCDDEDSCEKMNSVQKTELGVANNFSDNLETCINRVTDDHRLDVRKDSPVGDEGNFDGNIRTHKKLTKFSDITKRVINVSADDDADTNLILKNVPNGNSIIDIPSMKATDWPLSSNSCQLNGDGSGDMEYGKDKFSPIGNQLELVDIDVLAKADRLTKETIHSVDNVDNNVLDNSSDCDSDITESLEVPPYGLLEPDDDDEDEDEDEDAIDNAGADDGNVDKVEIAGKEEKNCDDSFGKTEFIQYKAVIHCKSLSDLPGSSCEQDRGSSTTLKNGPNWNTEEVQCIKNSNRVGNRNQVGSSQGSDSGVEELEEEDVTPPCIENFGQDLEIGDLVWGTTRGCHSWPGQIISDHEVRNTQRLQDGMRWVRWFGDHSCSQVDPDNLKSLSDGLEDQHKVTKKWRKGRKINPYLEAAIQEALAALDKKSSDKSDVVNSHLVEICSSKSRRNRRS